MVDLAGNELDPPYEEEVDGWFGGVLRMLEALWEFICAVVSAIADAVMKALSFLFEMIMRIVQEILDRILAPFYSGLKGWTDNIAQVIESLSKRDYTSESSTPDVPAQQVSDAIFSDNAMAITSGASVGIESIIVMLSVLTAILTAGASTAISKVSSAVVKVGKAVIKNANKIALATVANIASTILFSTFLSEQDDYWDENFGIGLPIAEFHLAMASIAGHMLLDVGGWAVLIGDGIALMIGLLGLLVSGVGGGIAAVIAVILAGLGMFWSIVRDDVIDEFGSLPWNLLEEVISTASFGYTAYKALEEVT
jgi:hypothetical protein